MKKIYLTALIAFGCTLGYGQGGSWYVGGILGYNSTSSDAPGNPTSSSWSVGPEVGTFFNEDWSAGLVLGLAGSNSKDDDGDISKMTMFRPNVYGRRWFSAGDRLSVFAGLDVAVGTGSTTTYIPTENSVDNSSFDVNLNAGVAYAMAERWTLLFKFAGLGYTSTKQGDLTTNDFGFLADGNITNGQFIFIGLYWTFIPAGAAE